jgi:hypothetical protein
VVLRRVPEPVDRLQDERLFLAQVLDLAVAQRAPHAGVETDRLLGALLADSPPAMQDRSLHQHLETMIELDQRATQAAPVVRSVEELDAQDKRIAGLLQQ